MSGKFVRKSAYRHVFGEAPKKDQQFNDVRPNPQGDGNCLAASADNIAFPMSGGGGPVAILALDSPGRQNASAKLAQHKAKVTDLAWNPFNSRMIATASEDCLVKATVCDAEKIKAGHHWTESDITLKGHQKKVTQVFWHPTAANVLASTSYDNTIKVWDVTTQAEICSIKGDKGFHNGVWNSDGSLIGGTGKDKQLYVCDPRSNGDGMKLGKGPPGNKAPRMIFVDNCDKIIVLGFTRSSTRQYQVYDSKTLECIAQNDIDQSAGLMMDHWDEDNNILYMAGKGDSSIKYFEITNKDPYLHYLSEFNDSSSQKGIGWAPKYSMDTSKCEIARAYRVLRDTIQPVSFCVPRKSDMFQEDIFPDTASWEPAHDQDSYKSGENKCSKKITMDPEQREGGPAKVEMVVKKSYDELEKELAAYKAKFGEL